MRNKYTKEQKEFLIANNYMRTAKDLTDMFNEKFGTDLTVNNIKNFRSNNKLKSGLTGRFVKGQISWNKGKKWDDYMSKEGQANSRKTTFKKGNIPHNHRPVGSERITKDGFVEIKIAEPNKWDIKARVIYERAYGKITKGYKVIYLDGDKLNLELSNLKIVSSAEELIMNKNNLRFSNKQLTETGHLIAKVINKRGQLKK